jgi:hypothetical protein
MVFFAKMQQRQFFLLVTKVEMASRKSLFDPSIEQDILIPCLACSGMGIALKKMGRLRCPPRP